MSNKQRPTSNKYGLEPGDILLKVRCNFMELLFKFLTGRSLLQIKVISKIEKDGSIKVFEPLLDSVKETSLRDPENYQVLRVTAEDLDLQWEVVDFIRMHLDLAYNYVEFSNIIGKYKGKVPRHGLEFDNKMLFSHLVALSYREAGVILVPEIRDRQLLPEDFRKSYYLKDIY
jgi:hypothetical protein